MRNMLYQGWGGGGGGFTIAPRALISSLVREREPHHHHASHPKEENVLAEGTRLRVQGSGYSKTRKTERNQSMLNPMPHVLTE